MTDLDDLIPRLEAVTAVLRSGIGTTKHIRHDAAGRIDKITEAPADLVALVREAEALSRRLGAIPPTDDDERYRVACANAAAAEAVMPYADPLSKVRLSAMLAEVAAKWRSAGRPLPGFTPLPD